MRYFLLFAGVRWNFYLVSSASKAAIPELPHSAYSCRSVRKFERQVVAICRLFRSAIAVFMSARTGVHQSPDSAMVANLARRLLLGHTTLEREFADYRYTKESWLSEAAVRP